MIYTPDDIKRIREENNLDQSQFAEQLGVTRELLNKMENGKRSISKATAVLLSQYVGKTNSAPVHTYDVKEGTNDEPINRKYLALLESTNNHLTKRIVQLEEEILSRLNALLETQLHANTFGIAADEVILQRLAKNEPDYLKLKRDVDTRAADLLKTSGNKGIRSDVDSLHK